MSTKTKNGDKGGKIVSMLDTSYLDEDTEEEDELVKTYTGRSVFQRKSRPASNENSPPTPNLTQSSMEDSPPVLTADEIEQKAQKFVTTLTLHNARNVHSLQDVGWRKTKKILEGDAKKSSSTCNYYPCCKLPPDDAELMFETGIKKNHIPIQYLGWNWEYAASYDQAVESTFVPLGTTDDEECLTIFLDRILGPPTGENALTRRKEELVLRASWDLIRKQEQAAKEQAKQRPDTLIPPARRKRQPSPAEKPPAAQEMSDNDDDDDSDSDDVSCSSDLGPRQLTGVSKQLRPGDVIKYYDPIGVAGKPEWLRQTEIIGVDPQHKSFPLNLRDGAHLYRDHRINRIYKMVRGERVEDTESGGFRPIESFSLRASGTMAMLAFREKVAIAKKSRADHAASVEQFWVDQANKKKKEALEAEQQKRPQSKGPSLGAFLDESKKERASKRRRSSVSSAVTGSLKSRASSDSTVLEIRKRRAEANQNKRKKPTPAYEPPSVKRRRKSEVARSSKKEPPAQKTRPEATKPTCLDPIEESKKVLESEIETVKKAMGGRRYKPHMTVEHLQVALQVWDRLQEEKDRKVEDAITELSQDLEVSHFKLTRFLLGDREKPRRLFESNILEIHEKLQNWLHPKK